MKEVLIRNKYTFIALAALLVFFGSWEIIARAMDLEVVLPTFTSVCAAFARLFITGNFWLSMFATLLRCVIGFVIAFVLGAILGIIAGKNRVLEAVLRPFNSVMRTVPVAAITLMLGIWLGSNIIPSVIGILLIFPVIYEQSKTAVRALPEELEEVMDEAGAGLAYRFLNLYLPSVLPQLLSNISATFGMNLKAVITAETLAFSMTGIGIQIYYAKNNFIFETPTLFAWVFAAVLMSVVLEALLKKAVGGLTAKIVKPGLQEKAAH